MSDVSVILRNGKRCTLRPDTSRPSSRMSGPDALDDLTFSFAQED